MAERKPKVLLFREDFKRVKDWVLSYPDRETGGQMFGLWTHERNPYINVITGPGKNSIHGTHSFHQDIDYLKSVGNFLNKEFMMCHIGEWHSHHKLRLRQPSSGDLNSIWKHFPAGVERFLLIIATIEDGDVRLNPWLFMASSHTYDAIEVKYIDKPNVFMQDEIVLTNIRSGEEPNKMQPRNYYPSASSKKSTSVPVDSEGLWFQSDWGCSFVQLLHSKLEEIKDRSKDIEMTKNNARLSFSCQTKRCCVVLEFHPGFPYVPLTIQLKGLRTRSDDIRWSEEMGNDQNPVEFIDQLVSHMISHINHY